MTGSFRMRLCHRTGGNRDQQMMVHLMAKEGRARYAGATPTPEEALAAYRSYGGYFGRFTVYENETPRYVVHNQEGRPRPATPTDAQRFYLLDGNILRLGGPPRTTDAETTGGAPVLGNAARAERQA